MSYVCIGILTRDGGRGTGFTGLSLTLKWSNKKINWWGGGACWNTHFASSSALIFSNIFCKIITTDVYTLILSVYAVLVIKWIVNWSFAKSHTTSCWYTTKWSLLVGIHIASHVPVFSQTSQHLHKQTASVQLQVTYSKMHTNSKQCNYASSRAGYNNTLYFPPRQHFYKLNC